ncbi:MAG: glycosyltransferase, partial [Candidatus Margulisbacteria bacterium]|nr:glycosyltransferase [Candidatus Margulisiibacteriota bacterium]
VTVSERYAEELKSGKTLHQEYVQAVAKNADKLCGTLNGISENFTPEGLFREGMIPTTFSRADLAGKRECHLRLQQQLGLPQDPEIPIVLWSQRLVQNKGIVEFSGGVVNQIYSTPAQIVIFGKGDKSVERMFESKVSRFPNQLRYVRFSQFNSVFEPSFIAGADIVVLPSHEEPCGLLMLKAMRLGTLPLVRPVGGLGQVVRDGENGFVLPIAESIENAMGVKLLEVYRLFAENKDAWAGMRRLAMEFDSSWEAPTEKYLQVYRQLAA